MNKKKKTKRTPEQMEKLREKQRKMMKVSMKKHKQNNNKHKVNGNMNNKVIKPFITRGSIVGTNGERKVVMNKDGLSPSQLDFVYGCERTLTETILKEEKEYSNVLITCMWIDKDDFCSGVKECKDDIDLDETHQEFVDMFNSKINKVNGLGIKFSPKHLTDDEVKYCRGFRYNNMVLSHKDGSISGKWGKYLFFPSPKSKEIWSIIYDTEPSLLNETTN